MKINKTFDYNNAIHRLFINRSFVEKHVRTFEHTILRIKTGTPPTSPEMIKENQDESNHGKTKIKSVIK